MSSQFVNAKVDVEVTKVVCTEVLLRTKTFCFFCLPNKQPPTHSAFKIPLIPATNNKITISKGIDPGKTYLISVYSLKGSKSSSVANITAVASEKGAIYHQDLVMLITMIFRTTSSD